ncbi:MAG: hypothetical protein LUI85_12230 [Bacteroides sp.]|nr:hypothetical protein [Bacteroides sp.]
MKKYIFTLLLLLVCHLGYAQNSDALFNEFRQEPNAEYVNASPFIMFIGKMFCHVDRDEGAAIVSKIHSAKVLDLDDYSREV